MADRISIVQRSRNMSRIRSLNTGPEMRVRRIVYALGFRYRLHAKGLPGRPDLVFRSSRKIIFVHGCFWHAHDAPTCPEFGRKVKSNRHYWSPKLAGNRERDTRHLAALKKDRWKILTVWDCETKNEERLRQRLKKFLEPPKKRRTRTPVTLRKPRLKSSRRKAP